MDANRQVFPRGWLAAVLAVLFVLSLGWMGYDNYAAGSEPWQIAVSSVMLSVPLGLLYLSIGVLVEAFRQRRRQGQVNRRMAKVIYRMPRIAGVLIVLFVGMFAMDVFSPGQDIWQMLLAFLIHASPAIALAVLLALAWRWEWVGFAAFLLAGLYFLRFTIHDSLLQALGMLLLFTGPMIVIALLFWVNWKWKIGSLRPW